MGKRSSNGIAPEAANTLVSEFTLGDSETKTFVLDAEKFFDDRDQYYSALLLARKIPRDGDPIHPEDPLIAVAWEYLSWMPESTKAEENEKKRMVVEIISSHYANLRKQAELEANVLALAVVESFENQPEPYTVPISRTVPGIMKLPEPTRNIFNPVEFRLKQVYDWLFAQNAFGQFMEQIETLTVDLNRKVDKFNRAGFQPSRTD